MTAAEQDRSRAVVAVVGAYGRVGRGVCNELGGDPAIELRPVGRDRTRLDTVVAELGGDCAARVVDVDDAHELGDACSGCDLVVNAAGPGRRIGDRVARAAMAARAHYVDPGGDAGLHRRLVADEPALRRRGQAFVLSAGWITGMTGVIPTWAVQLAPDELDRIDSVELLYGDCGDWSLSGFEDILHHVFRHSEFGWYEHGRWVPRGGWRLLRRPRRMRLPGRFGHGYVIPHYERELTRLGAVSAYPMVSSWVAPIIGPWTSLYLRGVGRFSTERAARRLCDLMARERRRRGGGGFVRASVRGERDGQAAHLRAQVKLGPDDDWVTAAVCATAVRHVLRAPRPGLAYLCDAVDPGSFVADLRDRGLPVGLSLGARSLLTIDAPAETAPADTLPAVAP